MKRFDTSQLPKMDPSDEFAEILLWTMRPMLEAEQEITQDLVLGIAVGIFVMIQAQHPARHCLMRHIDPTGEAALLILQQHADGLMKALEPLTKET